MSKDPYIIIGMHRSGTSLLARVLEKAGIFMGVVKDHNFEAMHFLSLNQQTLWAAGADWYLPKVPQQQFWKTMPKKVLYYEHFRVQYTLSRYKLLLQNPAWGFKDPRTTFTLNMWLSLYPNAKVIHLTRDFNAVLASLQTRNKTKGEVHQSELDDPDFCRQLWQKYLDTGRSYKSKLGSNYCEITYQDLCALDDTTVHKLEQFCDRPIEPALKKLLR
jgi:hypothetical protein